MSHKHVLIMHLVADVSEVLQVFKTCIYIITSFIIVNLSPATTYTGGQVEVSGVQNDCKKVQDHTGKDSPQLDGSSGKC